MGYVTLLEYRDYMRQLQAAQGVQPTADVDAQVQEFIDEATALIESETRRKFLAVTETRYYDSRSVMFNQPQLLILDSDLLAVTSLVNGDGSTIAAGDYWLEPRNEMRKHSIRLKSTKVWAFTTDGQIEVTGSWGFSATPSVDVKRITCRLAYIINKRRSATDNVEFVSADGASGSYKFGSNLPDDIREWLKRHAKPTRGLR